ncbi:MAG: cation:proton antiporter, partial [Chthoniobacteraceae bacterium]
MTALAILLFLAAVAMTIARRLRVPPMPILLCCGLGVSALGLAPARESLLSMLELGLTFLVFAAGVELSPRRFVQQRRPALWVSGILLLVIGPAGFVTARALGVAPLASLYLALTVFASSTLVALRELRRRQQTFEPFARVVTGVQLIQDIVLIVAIVVLAASAGDAPGIFTALWRAALLGGFAVICQRYLLPWLLIRRRPDEETLLLTVLALLFIFAGTARALGLPVIAGAFLAGFALSTFPLNGVVRGQLMTLSDFFSATFFTALGASLVVPELSLLLTALALAGIVLAATP